MRWETHSNHWQERESRDDLCGESLWGAGALEEEKAPVALIFASSTSYVLLSLKYR